MPRIIVFDKELFLNIPVLLTFDGKICPYTVMEGKYTRLITAYHSIQSDLLETQSIINFLKENAKIPGVVKASMFKAFIIQYAKCFSKAWGRSVKLEAKPVFDSYEELLKVHNEVMEMRNNYIAHAGTGKYDNGAMILYLNPDVNNPAIERIIHADLKFMDHSLKLPGYEKLCLNALEYVNLKIEKLATHYNNEVESKDIKELYSTSKTPNRKHFQFNDYGDLQEAREPKNHR